VKIVRRFLSYPLNALACAVLLCFLLAALFAPVLAPPEDPQDPSPFRISGRSTLFIPQPPSREAPLGTAPGQWDIYHTLIWGTRSALRFGLTVTLITATIGSLLGAGSAYAGGALQGLAMRLTDAFLTFPPIAGVWLFMQVLMPVNPFGELTGLQQALVDLKVDPILVTLILFSWMPYARLANANVRQLKHTEYVEAARALGVRGRRILFRHLLPNALPPLLVLAARDVGAMVILESTFAFVGLGGSTEWGIMLVRSRDFIVGVGGNPLAYWWVFVPFTAALILFGIGWNLLGDGLNTVLNPWLARR
jgi:peptide/nickel transport system permease protein